MKRIRRQITPPVPITDSNHEGLGGSVLLCVVAVGSVGGGSGAVRVYAHVPCLLT